MQAVSSVAYSVSKLFGTRGKLKDHHLNDEDILQEFRESKGMQKLMDMPSFQGSRMNWLVKVACTIVANHEVYLDYLHRLRYCTIKPNKLVMTAYEGLSDHTVLAALAARAIYCVEVSEVSVFFCKVLATRWELSEFYDLVILSLQSFCLKGELAASLLRTFPEFSQKIDAYVVSQADKIKAVYKAAKAFDDQWPHFMARACLAVLSCVMEHRDACVKGDPLMTTGFVTSCYIELFFGVLKDAHIATGKGRITNMTGVGAGIKTAGLKVAHS